MTAFALKTPRKTRDAYRTCVNKCRATDKSGLRTAVKEAVFMDTYFQPYSALLCRRCAQEWMSVWESATGSAR